MSPVFNQPSLSTSAVRFGSCRYPSNIFGPRSQSMPASYSDSLRFISGSRISAAMPGASLPTDPKRLDGCTCSPGRFGAGDNEAQTSELLRLGLTQIQAQERGRQKQKGKLIAFDQRRAVCRVEWIRICDNADTFDKRIPKCDR